MYLFFPPSCVNYVTPPDDTAILKTAHTIYRKMDRLPQALQIAVRLNDMDLIKSDFDSCSDACVYSPGPLSVPLPLVYQSRQEAAGLYACPTKYFIRD